MNTPLNAQPIASSSTKSQEIFSGVRVEWKNRSKIPVFIDDIVDDELPAKFIKTDASPGWIRIHIQLPSASRSIIGVRLLLKVKSDQETVQIRPIFVNTENGTNFRRALSSPEIQPLILSTNAWHEISGVYAFDFDNENTKIDLVVNLPSGADITLVDVRCDAFPATCTANRASGEITSLVAFHPRGVVDVQSWAAPEPIYGHLVQIEGPRISGNVVTKRDGVFVAGPGDTLRSQVPTNRPAVFGAYTLPSGGYRFALGKGAVGSGTVECFASENAQEPFWSGELTAPPVMTKPEKALFPREHQDNYILLWAPISIAGLTVQLEQVTQILEKNKIAFKVSYHIRPTIAHPLTKHWIEPRDIDSPKMVLYFERFHEFDRGFDSAFKVFYMNLDWLSSSILAAARIHANLVLCPTPYLLEDMKSHFTNAQVLNLPWPSHLPSEPTAAKPSSPDEIRILYVGNDYNGRSRKHPFEVIDAIRKVKREDVTFDLKFRTPLPPDLRDELQSHPRVKTIVDWPTDRDRIEDLYRRADINLIPNASEGNGLSILEAWAAGVIPAVLDGHPMIDVTSPEDSYRIACAKIGEKEYAPLYKTTSEDILNFINAIDYDDVRRKKATIQNQSEALRNRDRELEKTLLSCAKLSGIRTQEERIDLEQAHLPSKKFPDKTPRSGARVKDLVFVDRGQSVYIRKPRHVDVLLTTSKRPWCLSQSLDQILAAIRLSPFEHRLFVAIDAVDTGTLAIINARSTEIDQVIWTRDQHGLPYTWNTLGDILNNTVNRSETRPDYICYIQDDCVIRDPTSYFETMVGISNAAMPGYLGLVSGYYTEVHPGFADFEWNGVRVIASDSIDGKNFMGTPEVLASVGPLSWRFSDGMRRGNPGPVRGSHFDLWQWNESPNALKKQHKINLVLPDLCDHIASRSKDSTWNNDTTDEAVAKRVSTKKIYQTRTYGG